MVINSVKEREAYIILRKRNRIKLSDIAKFLGISIAAISRFEREKMNLRQDKEILYVQFIQKLA